MGAASFTAERTAVFARQSRHVPNRSWSWRAFLTFGRTPASMSIGSLVRNRLW
jgi:hypothetical protein